MNSPTFKFNDIEDIDFAYDHLFPEIIAKSINYLTYFANDNMDGKPGRVIIAINFDKGDQVYAYFLFGKDDTHEIEVDGSDGPLTYTLGQIESFLFALSDGESISEQIPKSIVIYLG